MVSFQYSNIFAINMETFKPTISTIKYLFGCVNSVLCFSKLLLINKIFLWEKRKFFKNITVILIILKVIRN